MTDLTPYSGAAALGVIAGMRTTAAPALITKVARSGQLARAGSKLEFLNSTGALSATALLAVGEIIVDKLPKTVARTAAGPLAARAISGAVCGAVLCSARKKSPLLGALYGAVGAVAAAYAAYHLRRGLKDTLHMPDPLLAVVEDAVVAGTGFFIASRLRDETA